MVGRIISTAHVTCPKPNHSENNYFLAPTTEGKGHNILNTEKCVEYYMLASRTEKQRHLPRLHSLQFSYQISYTGSRLCWYRYNLIYSRYKISSGSVIQQKLLITYLKGRNIFSFKEIFHQHTSFCIQNTEQHGCMSQVFMKQITIPEFTLHFYKAANILSFSSFFFASLFRFSFFATSSSRPLNCTAHTT